MTSENLTLRPVSDKDLPLLRTWLNKDYILKWYEDIEAWLYEIENRNEEFSWIHHFIVMGEEAPIGFCQYYDCYDANAMEEWYSVTQKGSTFSIDYLIGEENYLGMGYGKAIVRLVTEAVEQTAQSSTIIVQPESDNIPSNRALIANGYRFNEDKGYYEKRLVKIL